MIISKQTKRERENGKVRSHRCGNAERRVRVIRREGDRPSGKELGDEVGREREKLKGEENGR